MADSARSACELCFVMMISRYGRFMGGEVNMLGGQVDHPGCSAAVLRCDQMVTISFTSKAGCQVVWEFHGYPL